MNFLNRIGSKRSRPVLQRNKINLKTSTNRSVYRKGPPTYRHANVTNKNVLFTYIKPVI